MAASEPTAPDAANPRRRTITTVLAIMLVIMVVRDIFARRWAATT
jgi:hypothetical protein